MSTTNQQVNLYNIGVSYKKAEADIRGKFSLTKEAQIKLLNFYLIIAIIHLMF